MLMIGVTEKSSERTYIMKIKANREKLLSVFQTAASVVPSRSPKPILQNVKLEVSNDGATLMATDMEIGIRLDVPGIEVGLAGTAILPVGEFGSILRESSDETLEINISDSGTVVQGDRSEFQLPSENPDEFPNVTTFDEKQYHEVPARLLKELIKRTVFATDNESSRYALGGVMFEFEATKVTAVGTDGRRLAKMEGPVQAFGGEQSGERQTIIPTRSVQLIERAVSEDDAELQVAARDNDIIIRSPRATIFSRLVEGRYPKWRDVIPTWQDGKTLDFTAGPLLSAIRQASVVSREESRGIDFTFSEGSLIMSGSTADVGQTRVELPISYEGSPVTLTLDHRYVAEFLKVLGPEKTFTMQIRDAESAAYCSTEDGYGYVVMPLAKNRG